MGQQCNRLITKQLDYAAQAAEEKFINIYICARFDHFYLVQVKVEFIRINKKL